MNARIQFEGTILADPKEKVRSDGKAYVAIRVADNCGKADKRHSLCFDVSVDGPDWALENARKLRVKDRVFVGGRFTHGTWTTREGAVKESLNIFNPDVLVRLATDDRIATPEPGASKEELAAMGDSEDVPF